MVPVERKIEEKEKPVKDKGIKRKLEENEVKVKKENSEKAYIRQVKAYKRRWKEQKIQLVKDTPKDST